MAGYMGCNSTGGIAPNVIADPPAEGEFKAIEGLDDVPKDNDLDALLGTDVLSIRRGSTQSIRLTGNTDPVNANVHIDENSVGFVKGDYVLISDCTSADIFRITNNPEPKAGGKKKAVLTHAKNTNTSNKLSKAYGPDAEVFGFVSSQFFIRDTERDTGGGNPVTSLYFRERAIASGGAHSAATELVEGVENLQLMYGVDDNDDRSVDRYLSLIHI